MVHVACQEGRHRISMTATISALQSAHMTRPSVAADAVWQPASTVEDDDFTLIRRVAAKDRQAFEILYRRYARRLNSYLSRLLRQPEVVEEVLDDIMLVVWQHASRFDYTSRLSTWIFGIAYHKALKARARASKESIDALPDTPEWSEQDDPEGIMSRQELGHTLTRALEALPPEQRAVVELTFYHECSYQEIAAIAKCPVNTVKTRMFHARRRLAQLLADLGIYHSTLAGLTRGDDCCLDQRSTQAGVRCSGDDAHIVAGGARDRRPGHRASAHVQVFQSAAAPTASVGSSVPSVPPLRAAMPGMLRMSRASVSANS
jgi:RNA polymerase sigma factor (sigma-70 family)